MHIFHMTPHLLYIYIYNMASTVFVRYRGTAVCMCDVMRTVGGAHPSYGASSAIYIYIYIIWHQLCLSDIEALPFVCVML